MSTYQCRILNNLLSPQLRGSGFYGGGYWASRSFNVTTGNANLGSPKEIPRVLRDRRTVEEIVLDLKQGKKRCNWRADLILGYLKDHLNNVENMSEENLDCSDIGSDEQGKSDNDSLIIATDYLDFFSTFKIFEMEEEDNANLKWYLERKMKAVEKKKLERSRLRRPIEGKIEDTPKARKGSKKVCRSSKRQKYAECEQMNINFVNLHSARKSNFVAGRRKPARRINKVKLDVVPKTANSPKRMGSEQFDSDAPTNCSEPCLPTDKVERIRYLTKMRVRSFRARRKALIGAKSVPCIDATLYRTRHLTKMRVRAYRARQQSRRAISNHSARNIIRIPNPFRRQRIFIRIPNPFRRIALNEAPNFSEDDFPEDNIGAMSKRCPFCEAKLYDAETSSLCCANGKVRLPEIAAPPEDLRKLFTEDTRIAKHFRKNIRAYNSLFAFTSLGANIDERFTRNGIYKFRIHGAMYHRIGSVLPNPNQQPKFGQIYIYDSDYQNNIRANLMDGLDANLIEYIQNIINGVNPFAADFKMAAEMMENNSNLRLIIKERKGTDLRRYNAPTASEVAVIIPGDGMEETTCRDIILSKNDGTVKRISELNGSYDPLHYVLLFPHGDSGFHLGINYFEAPRKRQTVSVAEFYAYRLMIRDNDNSMLLRAGRLLQQYIVDAYSKVESGRISYIRTHQRELRADLYQGFVDAIANDIETTDMGQRIILPSSFTGSPRHMHQLYQDSMAIVRETSKPDVFTTFTCNPGWVEIQNELLPGQKAHDRPDLCARVFRLKLKKLLQKIIQQSFFGRVLAHIHVIEFQKRGLPHAHILIILAPEDKFGGVQDIDKFICAEIPDKDINPRLYEIVTKNMMHGPCGLNYPNAPCMVNGVCSKGFPKNFQNQTIDNHDGYPVYRRRDVKRTVMVKGAQLDNRWVVPYNPALILLFNAHINVEHCSSIVAVKYLYKYVYKGHDRASVQIGNDQGPVNECSQYLDGRYVSDCESFYRICGFRLHEEYPPVQRFQIHLPDQQTVVFDREQTVEQVLERGRHTMLTQWFELNRVDEQARELLYPEACKRFVWDKNAKKWKRRVRNNNMIGRMYFVPPMAGEKYYLRLLLHNIRGAMSFEDVRTYNGVCYPTFKEAANQRGLLDSDEEYRQCLQEAVIFQTGKQLRHLFVQILLYGEPATPAILWNEFKAEICEDTAHLLRTNHPNIDEERIPELAQDMGLLDINNLLMDNGKSLTDYPDMPELRQDRIMLIMAIPANDIIQEHTNFNEAELQELVNTNVPRFNIEQRAAYESITEAVDNENAQVFYLDGPGGTGKTFLFNTLLAYVRSQGKIALALASSGIAAQLLVNGRTAHSTLKIPININDISTCSIKLQSQLARLLQQVKLILWDEAPMMHKHVYEAVDRTLRDVMRPVAEDNAAKLFGGIPVVFGGDFRQILPVIVRGTQADIVNASLNKASFWNSVRTLRLETNMRVMTIFQEDAEEMQQKSEFAKMLLKIGEGTYPHDDNDNVVLPSAMCLEEGNIQSLIENTFPHLQHNYMEQNWLSQRAILTPKNEDMQVVNNIALDMLPGELVSLPSADTTEQSHVTVEFLNKLSPSGMPIHDLKLKVGCPVILLRNMDKKQQLCNGTKAIVRKIGRRVLEAEICVGRYAGQRVLIPRIKLMPSETATPFQFKRLQFPIHVAFAMSINKAQGQTLKNVGVFLPRPVFSHGQLYVAMSRVSDPNNLKMLIYDEKDRNMLTRKTKNVVYRSALRYVT